MVCSKLNPPHRTQIHGSGKSGRSIGKTIGQFINQNKHVLVLNAVYLLDSIAISLQNKHQNWKKNSI